jgi:hypothetical protein
VSRRDSGAGSTILVGIVAAVLAAVAAAKPWAVLSATGRQLMPGADATAESSIGSAGQAPLALALALVALAGWGALLVTRGWVRTTVTAVGTLAAAGLVVTTLVEFGEAPDAVAAVVAAASGGHGAAGAASRTGWYWLGLVAAVVLFASYAHALRGVRNWPTMGTRYDAPGGRPAAQGPTTNLEIWKAIDEGDDPTWEDPS